MRVGVQLGEEAARLEPAALAAPPHARHDQLDAGACHGDVVETQALGVLLALARRAHLLVTARPSALSGRGMRDLEAEAPVREREDLVRRGRLTIASRVRDDDDLELEPFRRMDRQ